MLTYASAGVLGGTHYASNGGYASNSPLSLAPAPVPLLAAPQPLVAPAPQPIYAPPPQPIYAPPPPPPQPIYTAPPQEIKIVVQEQQQHAPAPISYAPAVAPISYAPVAVPAPEVRIVKIIREVAAQPPPQHIKIIKVVQQPAPQLIKVIKYDAGHSHSYAPSHGSYKVIKIVNSGHGHGWQ